MIFSKVNEFIDIWFYRFNSPLHCGDGISVTLKTYALTKDSTKTVHGNAGSATCMTSLKITSKDKYIFGPECGYTVWSVLRIQWGVSDTASLWVSCLKHIEKAHNL